MPIIKSISGIRGTIGDKQGEDLTLDDVSNFSAAYGSFIRKNRENGVKVVVGRDARVSGGELKEIVIEVLIKLGIDVIDLDLATTPTVEMAVIMKEADGGIILTASHNPQEWNALKMLNSEGEFLSAEEGKEILEIADRGNFDFFSEDNWGKVVADKEFLQEHINKILELGLVDTEVIEYSGFKVVVDGINSVGGFAVPELLRQLGVGEVIGLHCEPNGLFAHNPEPLEKNLGDIMEKVRGEGADLGIVVDPDVDRLAFIDEKGKMFGEEYTLVAVADYILSNYSPLGEHNKKTVSNLSSSRALRDVTEKYNGEYFASAVGEVHVVSKMKETGAVIGGEGNGGIIYPELHYGRDALVGIALFLSYLAKKKKKASELKKDFSEYHMVKDKLELGEGVSLDDIFHYLKEEYKKEEIADIDGLKIDYDNSWVHLRASNTEPIIRLYAEAGSLQEAEALAREIKEKILSKIS